MRWNVQRKEHSAKEAKRRVHSAKRTTSEFFPHKSCLRFCCSLLSANPKSKTCAKPFGCAQDRLHRSIENPKLTRLHQSGGYWRGYRQSERERAAATLLGFNPNFSTMQLHKRFGDSEAKARSFGFQSSALGDLIEFLKDLLTLLGRNPRTIIIDGNLSP